MNQQYQRLAENLASVRLRIAEAATRAGRQPHEVRLIAVTKYVSAEIASLLAQAGCKDLGESRPQELWRKAEMLRSDPALSEVGDLRWHLIGHLQRNKVRQTLPHVNLVQSGDSVRLLAKLDEEAERVQRCLPVLLEVNISGDATKHGFEPEELDRLLREWPRLRHLEIRGLMAMASRLGGAAEARRDFAALRELRDRLRRSAPSEVGLEELSMGMSGDFEVAIEEGATMVRVGSALFEGLTT